MRLVTIKELQSFVMEDRIIQNGKLENVEGIKYDLRISNKLLSGTYPNSINIEKLNYEIKERLSVAPGELVFLLTEEILCLPDNMMATIISKRKMNHEGVLVLGGSIVDPLYNGRLLFGLYNFSSESFPVLPGRKIISIMLYKIDDSELGEFPKPEARIDYFPDELLKNMKKYKPTSNQNILNEMKGIKIEIEGIKKKFNSNQEWFTKFQDKLDKINKTLEKEIENRHKSMNDLKQVFHDRDRTINDSLNLKLLKYTAVTGGISAAIVTILGIVMFLLKNSF